jgi:hypothetical protein
MTTLDCSSVQKTIETLSDLLGTSIAELTEQLRSFKTGVYDDDPEEVILRRILGANDREPRPTRTKWFHATRVSRGVSFKTHGLLPLARCINDIRATISGIADELGIPPGHGPITHSYALKLEKLDRQGPCAFLLKDAALAQSRAHRNFLKSPEIVDDIASACAGDRAGEILDVHRSRTQACIVTFHSSMDHSSAVRRALAYVYAVLHDHADPLHWNTCFEGAGTPVSPECIASVEWLDA